MNKELGNNFYYLLFYSLCKNDDDRGDGSSAVEEGVGVGGELLKDVKFAENQGMVAHTEKGLQSIIDALSKIGKEYNVKINFKKTKMIRVYKKLTRRR